MNSGNPAIHEVAAALAHPVRAAMVLALMDGRFWTLGELGKAASVSRSSATEHMNQLVASGLVVERREGRHRYLALASREVAALIEAIGSVSEVAPASTTYRAQRAQEQLRVGRTCYRHFAGVLGQEILSAWRAWGFIGSHWTLTDTGARWAESVGIDLTRARRELVRPCLDWTERVDHAAGFFPDAFSEWAFDQRIVERGSHPRSARFTERGREWVACPVPAAGRAVS